jgi:hypothetical protein
MAAAHQPCSWSVVHAGGRQHSQNWSRERAGSRDGVEIVLVFRSSDPAFVRSSSTRAFTRRSAGASSRGSLKGG